MWSVPPILRHEAWYGKKAKSTQLAELELQRLLNEAGPAGVA
jgi:hypothetical protein